MRKGENMRQTSEKFMDELLKDSEPAEQQIDYSEKISEILDKKIAKAMEKYTAEVEKVNEPNSSPGNEVETPVEDTEETEDETINTTTEEGENENE